MNKVLNAISSIDMFQYVFRQALLLGHLISLVALISGCDIEHTEELVELPVRPIPLDKLHAHFPTGLFGANLAETVPGDIATVNP